MTDQTTRERVAGLILQGIAKGQTEDEIADAIAADVGDAAVYEAPDGWDIQAELPIGFFRVQVTKEGSYKDPTFIPRQPLPEPPKPVGGGVT